MTTNPDRIPPAPEWEPPEPELPAPHLRCFDRKRAAAAAKQAYIVIRPDRNAGGPTLGSTNVPTEAVVAHLVASKNYLLTANHFNITIPMVWAAVWFEMGVDSRRRYHL